MKSHLTIHIGLVLALATAIGCSDRQAAQKQQARQEYAQALEMLEQAHRGLMDPQAPLTGDMEVYRQEKLASAARELERLTGTLDAAEQASAKRTLSAVYRSMARRSLGQAVMAWSDWSQDQAGWWPSLTAVNLAEGRAAMHDPEVGSALQRLQAIQAQQQKQIAGIESDSQQLRQAMTKAQVEQRQAISQRDTVLSQIQKLKSEAFVQQGKKQLETEKQVTDLQRQASEFELAARRHEIVVDQKQAELAVLDRRMTLARLAMQSAESNAQAIRRQSQSAQQAKEMAINDVADPTSRTQAVKNLENVLAQAAPGIQAVMAKFEAARQLADKSAALAAQSASSGGAGSDRRYLRSESLAAYVLQVDVLTSELAAQGAVSQTLQAMQKLALQYQVASGVLEPIAQAIASLNESRQKLSESARQAVGQANELAKELGAGDASADVSNDPVAAMAAQQAQALQQGRQRLEQMTDR